MMNGWGQSVGSRRGRRPSGFTLIELLVVVAIIGLLVAVFLPVLSRVMETARRAVCLANMRSMGQAAWTYSIDSSVGVYIPTLGDGNDDLAYLYPYNFDVPEAAVCASTVNVVDPSVVMTQQNAAFMFPDRVSGFSLERIALRTIHNRDILLHLTALARGRDDDGTTPPPDQRLSEYNFGGHSYEVDAWMNEAVWPDGVATVGDIERNKQRGWDEPDELHSLLMQEFNPDGEWQSIKTTVNVKAPSRNRLMGDGDAGNNIDRSNGSVNNYPDEFDNHGSEGLTIAMCDGSAKWLPSGPDVILTYLESRRSPEAINNTLLISDVLPELRIQSTVVRGRTIPKYVLDE